MPVIEIHNTPEPEEEKRKKRVLPFWRRLVGYLARIVVGLFLFLLVAFVTVWFAVQTEWFHFWIKDLALNLVNERLDGKIEVDDYKINLFKLNTEGLELYGFRLLAAGDTVVNSPHVKMSFNPEVLFNNSVVVHKMTLDSARVRVTRNLQDSLWNFEKIAKRSTDTSASPNWTINISDLRLQNSKVYFYDSTSKRDADMNRIDFTHLDMDSVNLRTSVNMQTEVKKYNIGVHSMSFYDMPSKFRVNHLAAAVRLNEKKIDVPSLTLRTEKGNLHANILIDSINVFAPDFTSKFQYAPINIRIDADSLDDREVRKLAPLPTDIVGKYKLSGNMSGNFANLNLTDVDIYASNTHLKGEVFLGNMDTENDFLFKVKLAPSTAVYSDLLKHLKFLDLSAFKNWGALKVQSAYVEGRNSIYKGSVDMAANFGKAAGIWEYDNRRRVAYYKVNADLQRFNFAQLINDAPKEFVSNYNGKLIANGSGFSLKDMNTQVQMNAYGTTMFGYYFEKAVGSLAISGGGLIDFDKLTLVFPRTSEDVVFNGIREIPISPTAVISGQLDMRTNITGYDLKAQLTRIDLAKLFKIDGPPSKLSGMVEIVGRGVDLDDIDLTVRSSITELTFEDRVMFPFELTLDIQKLLNNRRSLTLISPFAELNVQGKFGFKTLIEAMTAQGQYFSDFANSKLDVVTAVVKDTNELARKRTIKTSYGAPSAPIDVTFKADIRDLSPLRVFIDSLDLVAQGVINGSFKGSPKQYQFTVDTAIIDNLSIVTPTSSFKSSPVQFAAEIHSDNLNSNPKMTLANISVKTDSVMNVNDILLEAPFLKLNYDTRYAEYTISTGVNNIADVALHGTMDSRGAGGYDIMLDSLSFIYQNSLGWSLLDSAHASLDSRGIDIDRFVLKRSEAETVSLQGLLKEGGFEDLQVDLQKFPLRDVELFVPDLAMRERVMGLDGRIDSLHLLLNGTFLKPVIDGHLISKEVTYNSVLLGDQILDFHHENANITGKAEILAPVADEDSIKIGRLFADIKALPFNLAFADIPERMKSGAPVDIDVIAEKAQLALIGPFVPAVNDVKGWADAKIQVRGTAPDNIDYEGDVLFKRASFILQSTNIKYYAQGKLSLHNDNLVAENIQLRNAPSDLNGGSAKITGEMKLTNLTPGQMKFTIESPKLLVLSPSSETVSPNLFGEFVIATGNDPLVLSGTFENPFLSGDVDILTANLEFPKRKVKEDVITAFRYQIDTAAANDVLAKLDSLMEDQAFTDSLQVSNEENSDDYFFTEQLISEGLESSSFADRLIYNLNIRILGRFFVRMEIFGADQLTAEIRSEDRDEVIRFKTGSDGAEQLFGRLQVASNSTYKYFKVFDAAGSLDFNLGDIDNPNLNLTAVYNGQRTLDGSTFDNYSVTATITGTKKVPKITFTYAINGVAGVGDEAKTRGDAVTLLALGRTQDEMRGLGGLEGTAWAAALTSVSKELAQALQSTGFIQDADVELAPGNTDPKYARLRFTGQLFGGVLWRFSGTLGDFTSNSQVAIEIPLSEFGWDSDFAHSTTLQLLTAINPNATNANRLQKNWEVRLGSRFTW
ncbi:MAG: hypothetical protein V4642_10420 [Bacteroidota bacterium]